MLTEREIKIIKDSIPFLKEHGKALAVNFYNTMFQNNPEVKKYFNMDRQSSGKQSEALAKSILAAASHIDNLSEILPAAKRIGEVHCKAGIQPKHYPIVGKNLLLTLQSMLGETATEEFMTAWKKAYEEIAKVFIQTEQEIYARQAASRS